MNELRMLFMTRYASFNPTSLYSIPTASRSRASRRINSGRPSPAGSIACETMDSVLTRTGKA